MVCRPINTPGDMRGFACGPPERKQRCSNTGRSGQCSRTATLLCDFPKADKGTCDKPLCEACAAEVGPDRHYCPSHGDTPMTDLFQKDDPRPAPPPAPPARVRGAEITLVAQIAEVRREIGMRQRNYPKWIAQGWLKQHVADAQMEIMRAVLSTLEDLHRVGIVS